MFELINHNFVSLFHFFVFAGHNEACATTHSCRVSASVNGIECNSIEKNGLNINRFCLQTMKKNRRFETKQHTHFETFWFECRKWVRFVFLFGNMGREKGAQANRIMWMRSAHVSHTQKCDIIVWYPVNECMHVLFFACAANKCYSNNIIMSTGQLSLSKRRAHSFHQIPCTSLNGELEFFKIVYIMKNVWQRLSK